MKWIYRTVYIDKETGERLTDKDYHENWYTIHKKRRTFPEGKNMITQWEHLCNKKQFKQTTLWTQ